jgi:hypothetical protein
MLVLRFQGCQEKLGFDVVIEIFCPSKEFIKVDLPTFGNPIIATYPAFVFILIFWLNIVGKYTNE